MFDQKRLEMHCKINSFSPSKKFPEYIRSAAIPRYKTGRKTEPFFYTFSLSNLRGTRKVSFRKGTALWGDRPSAGNTKNLVGICLQSIVLLTFPRQRERKRALGTLGGVGKGTIRKGVPCTKQWLGRAKPMNNTGSKHYNL